MFDSAEQLLDKIRLGTYGETREIVSIPRGFGRVDTGVMNAVWAVMNRRGMGIPHEFDAVAQIHRALIRSLEDAGLPRQTPELECWNDLHYTTGAKRAARERTGAGDSEA